jgi:hypothetical protein
MSSSMKAIARAAMPMATPVCGIQNGHGQQAGADIVEFARLQRQRRDMPGEERNDHRAEQAVEDLDAVPPALRQAVDEQVDPHMPAAPEGMGHKPKKVEAARHSPAASGGIDRDAAHAPRDLGDDGQPDADHEGGGDNSRTAS